MTSRKGSISLVPRVGNSIGNKSVAPVSARYEKALQVLSEERLRQACRLVMQESTTTEDQEKSDQLTAKAEDTEKNSASIDETEKDEKKEKVEKTVLQQLLQSYRECEAAVKVIQNEAPSDMFLSRPPSMPLARTNTAGAARPHAKPLLHAKHPPSASGLKAPTTATGTLLNRGNRIHRPDAQIMRGSRTSLTVVPPSHFGGGSTSSAMTSAVSNSVAAATTAPSRTDLNPPPEARQFLAMLNQDTPNGHKMSSQSSSSSSPQTIYKTKNFSPPQMPPKIKVFPQRKRKAEEEEVVHEKDEKEEDASAGNDDVGKETKKDMSTTGQPKRTQSGSDSSPSRRVQPRRSARISE